MSNQVPVDAFNRPIPVFTPRPLYCTTLTIAGGGTITWTPDPKVSIFKFHSTVPVELKLNNLAGGLHFYANENSDEIGVHADTTTITFAGTAGGVIDIWAM
jgi:hypothetical protein